MSLPTIAGAPMAAMAPVALGPIDTFILSLNSNPYFIGIMMLLLNLGGRFLSMEITKSQEQFFQNPWVRRLLIFTVLFVGTRNVMVAFWLTLIIILCIGYLFNENSSLCLYKIGNPGTSCAEEKKEGLAMMSQSPFTPEEAEIYRRLNEKQLRFAAAQRSAETSAMPAKMSSESPLDLYWKNMALLGITRF